VITRIEYTNQQVLHGRPASERWLCTIDFIDTKLNWWHQGVGVCCSRIVARIKAGRDLRRKWRERLRAARHEVKP
jgi:hypothetical protein